MTAMQNFVFEDHLVRIVEKDGDPWFVGKDICMSLGGSQEMIIVSEPGMYQLVFASRKPEAKRFRRWIAHEVLPQIRRTGFYGTPPADSPLDAALPPPPVDVATTDLREALALVRECRLLKGTRAASRLWDTLPALPKIPAPRTDGDLSAAAACLEHLLHWKVKDRLAGDRFIRDILDEATRGSSAAERALRDLGIRLVSDDSHGDGIAVASSLPGIFTVYENTPWKRGSHRMALRALPGAMPWKAMKFTGTHASMGTFIPMVLILGE